MGAGLPFPDFARITIVRPSRDSTNETRITVNLLNQAGAIDATKDMPLEFGDVVEVPESDHALGERFDGLPNQIRDALAAVSRGKVQLIVKGKTTELEVYPLPAYSRLKTVLATDDAKKVLLASSDLSRVKVTRHDPKTGRDQTWTVDCSTSAGGNPSWGGAIPISSQSDQTPSDDLWLRSGDVVEVPEKG
jgi:hypothetical protein